MSDYFRLLSWSVTGFVVLWGGEESRRAWLRDAGSQSESNCNSTEVRQEAFSAAAAAVVSGKICNHCNLVC